jgi:hypothetical protein
LEIVFQIEDNIDTSVDKGTKKFIFGVSVSRVTGYSSGFGFQAGLRVGAFGVVVTL